MGCFYLNPVWNFVINTWGIFLLWNVIMQECICVCVCVHAHGSLFWLCFVLCFVMDYVLQFGETAHKRVCYHMYRNAYIDTPACTIACSHVCAHTHTHIHTHTRTIMHQKSCSSVALSSAWSHMAHCATYKSPLLFIDWKWQSKWNLSLKTKHNI